jgi:hypothetical protein
MIRIGVLTSLTSSAFQLPPDTFVRRYDVYVRTPYPPNTTMGIGISGAPDCIADPSVLSGSLTTAGITHNLCLVDFGLFTTSSVAIEVNFGGNQPSTGSCDMFVFFGSPLF